MMNSLYEKERTYLKWKYLYYVGKSQVDDHVFDSLEDELKELKSNVVNIVDCPTLKILSDYNLISELAVGEKDVRFHHDFEMASLKKHQVKLGKDGTDIYPTDLCNFVNQVSDQLITSTPKFDGNSMELTYIDGILYRALTRGNVEGGLDKTDRVKLLVPNKIEFTKKGYKTIIRGELIIPTKTWESKWSDPTKPDNPRNWLSGIINKDDIDHDALKDIHFMAFRISFVNGDDVINPENQLDILQSIGFERIFSIDCKGVDDFFKNVYPKFKEYRKNCPYLMDGIVINFLPKHWKELGETSHHPRWACAVKFPPKGAVTKITDIIWTLGKDGEYTPIAILEPVELEGSMVKQASLHNLGWIIDNGTIPGCIVEIAKKGDIIPQIVSIITKSEHENEYLEYINDFIHQNS